MRDIVITYTVPDYRPLYNAVVREIKWVGADMSEGKYNALLDALEIDDEDGEMLEYLPKSYTDEYATVLRLINPKVNTNKRFYVWAKRF
jgi:hypothetical protein